VVGVITIRLACLLVDPTVIGVIAEGRRRSLVARKTNNEPAGRQPEVLVGELVPAHRELLDTGALLLHAVHLLSRGDFPGGGLAATKPPGETLKSEVRQDHLCAFDFPQRSFRLSKVPVRPGRYTLPQ